MFKRVLLLIVTVMSVSACSGDKEDGNKFNSEGTLENPLSIEVDVVHRATVSGDAVTSTGFSSYYVFTAPDDGSYQITVDNMDMEFPDGGGSNNDKTLWASMAHISIPYEEGSREIDYEVFGNTPCRFELVPVRKGQKYEITITNLTHIDALRGTSVSYSKQFDLLVSKYQDISGSIESPTAVQWLSQGEFTSVGQCCFCYPGFDTTSYIYHFESDIYDTYSICGEVVSTIKIDLYRNSFDPADLVTSLEGNIGEITVDLTGWSSSDTPYFNVYSPDNRYWGLWTIIRD